MSEIVFASCVFACLVAASVGGLLIHRRFPEAHRQEDTHNVIRLTANLFVVMSSLMLGLLINNSKNTFDSVDHNVHAFAAELILLDRTLRIYGPEATDARARLAAYVERAIAGTWPSNGSAPEIEDPGAERLLDAFGAAVNVLAPTDEEHRELKAETRQRLQKVVELRWALIEHWDGTVPTQLLVLLVCWLMLIFASFGYRAPVNATVIGTMVTAALLASGGLYLILDMDTPFAGAISVSPASLQTALAHIRG